MIVQDNKLITALFLDSNFPVLLNANEKTVIIFKVPKVTEDNCYVSSLQTQQISLKPWKPQFKKELNKFMFR